MYKNIKEFKKFYDKEEEEEKEENDCGDAPKVLKVKDPDKFFIKKCNPVLPQPPACMIICSPIKTGKTTLLSNLLLNPNFYGKDYFDEVIIISNTICNDITGRFLLKSFTCHNKEKEKIFDEYGDLFGGYRNLENIYKLCTPNRYDFMYLSMQDNPPLAYKNFDTLIAEGDKIVSNSHNNIDNEDIKEDDYNDIISDSDSE